MKARRRVLRRPAAPKALVESQTRAAALARATRGRKTAHRSWAENLRRQEARALRKELRAWKRSGGPGAGQRRLRACLEG